MGSIISNDWHVWAWPVGLLGGAVLLALAVQRISFALLSRWTQRKGGLLINSFTRHSRRPLAWILPFVALLAALPAAHLPANALAPTQRAVGLGLIAATGWLAIVCSAIVFDVVSARYRLDVEDNIAARRVQTQAQVLHRIVVVLVLIVTLSVMLMTFPEIKHIGISLLASAGLAGLVIGTAMKSSLSSLIAGVQIAFTQPIRLEDAVVVEGEWGWVEEIGTTYVIVRLWDLRRMVLPLSYFLEHPFQNWTRHSADLLGSVFLYVDYTVPVEEVRQGTAPHCPEQSEMARTGVCAAGHGRHYQCDPTACSSRCPRLQLSLGSALRGARELDPVFAGKVSTRAAQGAHRIPGIPHGEWHPVLPTYA